VTFSLSGFASTNPVTFSLSGFASTNPETRGRENVRLGFALAETYPPPFCLLEWFAGECFQSFASISNRVSVISPEASGSPFYARR
jgi:hypothetical protein